MEFGDRMKMYEKTGATTDRLMPLLPAMIRLDGKSFHTFTKGLDRPFDNALSSIMILCTKMLVKESNAIIGYTQSDEITLILYRDTFESQLFFDGKVDKINSILAAKCSVYFNSLVRTYLPDRVESQPVFDCRSWNMPNKTEAVNCLVWREQDATRNSIQMAGRAKFSHRQLHGMNCNKIQEKLWLEENINWNDYPPRFKRGTYVAKVDGVCVTLDMPRLTSIENREEVIFDNAEPILKEEQ